MIASRGLKRLVLVFRISLLPCWAERKFKLTEAQADDYEEELSFQV
jgi:hypothetical protein